MNEIKELHGRGRKRASKEDMIGFWAESWAGDSCLIDSRLGKV